MVFIERMNHTACFISSEARLNGLTSAKALASTSIFRYLGLVSARKKNENNDNTHSLTNNCRSVYSYLCINPNTFQLFGGALYT